MVKGLCLVIMLAISAASFSQQTTNPSPVLTKQDYLQKSKTQKTVGWILLGGGVVINVRRELDLII